MAWLLSSLLPLILVHFLMISAQLSSDNPNASDLTALLDFKNRIIDDPLGVVASWNDSSHYCNWTGITCDPSNARVRILSLMSRKLVGSLPPSIGNLSFLESIELRNNSFRGELPREIGLLSSLKHLNLSYNMLSGSIPWNLSNCTQLTVVVMEYNQLSGEIPSQQFSALSRLEVFSVRANNLTGSFPEWIGNLSSSRFSRLSLALNRFHGSIPPEVGRLHGMTFFQVYGNQFSGELPPSIYNLSSMNVFSVTQNQLQGEFPSDIGLRYPNLERFVVGMNNFTGEIPASLANASRLALVDLAVNSLTGTLPAALGSLPFLYWINVEHNFLGSGGAGDLNFISSLTNCTNLQVLGLLSNRFGGELPSSVANLSTMLEMLTLGDNQLHGNIPYGIGNLVNVTALGFELNMFTGGIPDDIGRLRNLRILQFDGNELTGIIPPSLGNLTSVIQLHLNSNRLQGSIPPQLGNCTSLLYLNISSNNLTGSIPKEVVSLSSLSVLLSLSRNSLSGPLPSEASKLTNLKVLDVSENKLSGKIPSSLSRCVSLEFLLMGGNRFNGTIQESLEALRALEEIDLSHNNLSGEIPEFLAKLPLLKKLDLSFNDLVGKVSNEGVFSNSSAVSVYGNKQLCGGDSSLHLPACLKPAPKSNKKHKLMRWLIPVTVSAAFCVVLIFSLSLWYILRKPKEENDTPSSSNDMLPVSYRQLRKATNGFSADNLVGSGSFGSVYKGILESKGSLVAVKVLNLEQRGAIKSFMDECAILKAVRHRNLVKIITVCSSFDQVGQEFKCLVTEFMVNGSLDTWLHPRIDARTAFRSKTFSLMQRLNIAIDVACALDYLHNQSHTPIIHCDLKPSNILLDQEFTAHVADFGLSKFLLESQSRDDSLSIQLKGSIGYIPPEYGTSTRISCLGDVYSYGVVILELFTGKSPTDDMFNNGVSIHEHVAMALPQNVMDVVDPSLLMPTAQERDGDATREGLADCLTTIMKIGVSCSMLAPRDRMNISIVVNQLQSIRNKQNW